MKTWKAVIGMAVFFRTYLCTRRQHDGISNHIKIGITPVSLRKRDTKIDTTLVRNRTKFLSAGA